MRVKFEKNGKEFLMFNDYWKLFQSVWGIESTVEYWESVTKEAEAFAQKYGKLGVGLAVALLSELKRRSEEVEA